MLEEGAKTDMERMGLFQEMRYLHGKGYVWPSLGLNAPALKGRQMLGPGSKLKAATQAGYFDEEFGRVFTGEAYTDPIRRRRLIRLEAEKLKIVPFSFKPPRYPKKLTGAGSYYGTFGGVIEAFSPVEVEEPPPRPVGRNVITNPGKKGGYGYVHICINPYPLHLLPEQEELLAAAEPEEEEDMEAPIKEPFRLGMYPEEYFAKYFEVDLPTYRDIEEAERFEGTPFINVYVGKKLGGCKAGCFSKFPKHPKKGDPYKPFRYKGRPVYAVNASGKLFRPVPGPKFKLLPIKSIVYQNVDRIVNHKNYETVKGAMYLTQKKPASVKN